MLDDFKNLFRGDNFIGQLIVSNALLFLVFNLLANLPSMQTFVYDWLALPATLGDFVWQPWSIVTYMFMHGGLRHLFYNMIILYLFGRIFRDFMGNQRLVGLYFLGGIGGGLFYVALYSFLLLAGENVGYYPLVGASAAIMAVVAAVGFRFGDNDVNLMFIGRVQLKYVALVIFVLSTVIDLAMNFGGKMSHVGGAAVGYIYVKGLERGKDYALLFTNWFKRLGKLFQRGPRMRVVNEQHRTQHTKTSTGSGPTVYENQARMDAILDKISKSGYENLSKDEKEFLFKMSNKQ